MIGVCIHYVIIVHCYVLSLKNKFSLFDFFFQARPHDTAPTPPPSHQNPNCVIVRQFIAQTSDQLTVYEGELVTLERADSDWAFGEFSCAFDFSLKLL